MINRFSHFNQYLRRLFIVCCLSFVAFTSRGQWEFSSGIDMSYPVLLNSSNSVLNYGQISFGMHIGVAYKPEDVQFFPILISSFGRTRLPLVQYGKDNVAALNFNYLNEMLNENFVIHFPESELFIYGGIGFSYLPNKGLVLAGSRSGTMKSAIDSSKNINKVFPAMNLGFEYIWGESTGKDLYLSMGINFEYILLLSERNTYYISINDPQNGISQYKASLTGNVISPGFYIALHYIFHKK
jgi:hypothetical protein